MSSMRRAVGSVMCGGTIALFCFAGPAFALTVRSATTTTAGSNGLYTATAHCHNNEYVVSGGFSSPQLSYAYISRAKGDRAWTVSVEGGSPVNAFAYCSTRFNVSQRSGTKHIRGSSGARGTAGASCPSGENLVSGGYAVENADRDVHDLIAEQDRRASSSRWVVSALNDVSKPSTLDAFAYCLHGTDVKVRSAKSAPIASNSAGFAVAHCHNGEQLLSGGYVTSPKPDWHDVSGPDLFYFRSARSGSDAWKAAAYNFGTTGTITAFAYCKA